MRYLVLMPWAMTQASVPVARAGRADAAQSACPASALADAGDAVPVAAPRTSAPNRTPPGAEGRGSLDS